MRYVVLFAFFLFGCGPSITPDSRPAAAAANESDRLTAIAVTQGQGATNAAFNHSQTQTALPFAVTALAQQAAITQVYVEQKKADAVATQVFRVTDAAYSAIVIPTKIAAVGTSIAVQAERDKAELESARSMSNLIGLFALGFLAGLGIGFYWLLGRARADVKRRNILAEAKPDVVGGMIILPPGYTSQKIVYSTASTPALAAPVAIENRDVPVNQNGHTGSIHVSQPVNEHEKIWRLFLYEVSKMFQQYGLSSTATCGAGKPFSSGTTWKIVTDIMRDNGLILKDNGDDTLPNGEWGDVLARIQDANKPLKLPARLPPPLRKFTGQNV